MNVDVFVDPACPFCWVTSRWVVQVAPERSLDVRWRSISNLMKNQPPADSPFHAKAVRARNLLRVLESVRAAGGESKVSDLYTEVGRHIHNRDDLDFDVAEVLVSVGLDGGHAAALEDAGFDQAIQASMDDALALTGTDVGTPLLAIDGPGGRRGISGPVLLELPAAEESLALWDAVVVLVGSPHFSELKRGRAGRPTPPPEAVLDRLSDAG